MPLSRCGRPAATSEAAGGSRGAGGAGVGRPVAASDTRSAHRTRACTAQAGREIEEHGRGRDEVLREFCGVLDFADLDHGPRNDRERRVGLRVGRGGHRGRVRSLQQAVDGEPTGQRVAASAIGREERIEDQRFLGGHDSAADERRVELLGSDLAVDRGLVARGWAGADVGDVDRRVAVELAQVPRGRDRRGNERHQEGKQIRSRSEQSIPHPTAGTENGAGQCARREATRTRLGDQLITPGRGDGGCVARRATGVGHLHRGGRSSRQISIGADDDERSRPSG